MNTPSSIKTFITAGNAIFTAVSRKTGERYTYRVRLSNDKKVHFVSVLTGRDNTSDYTFIGVLRDGKYVHSKRTPIGDRAKSVLGFRWVWEHVAAGNAVPATDLHHCGKCGRCARALTVPESILSGIGPECAQILGLTVKPVKRSRKTSAQVQVPADIIEKQARIDAERAAGYDV